MKKLFSLMLGLMLVLGAVAGAGAEGGKTLEVWYALSGASGEAFLSVVDDFNAQNTGISINASYSGGYTDTATKITAALLSNTTPDVLIGGQVTYTGAYGNFYAGEKVLSDAEFNYDDVFTGLWDYAMYNGVVCNIPYGISTPVMYYNKAVVEAAGVDMTASAPASWEDFTALCETIQAHYADNAAFAAFVVKDMPWLFKTQLRQVGNNVIAANEDFSVKTAAFGSPECARVAQWWQDMVKAGVTTVGDSDNAENVFLAGNAAFFAGSSTKIADWSETMGDNLQAIPMPCFDEPFVALGGNTISIFPTEGDEAQSEAAWTFVKFVTGTEENAKFALASGYLPIRASALELDSMKEAFESKPAYKIAFDQLAYAYSYYNIDDYAALDNAIKGAIAKVTGDTAYDCAQAMAEAAQAYDDEANN